MRLLPVPLFFCNSAAWQIFLLPRCNQWYIYLSPKSGNIFVMYYYLYTTAHNMVRRNDPFVWSWDLIAKSSLVIIHRLRRLFMVLCFAAAFPFIWYESCVFVATCHGHRSIWWGGEVTPTIFFNKEGANIWAVQFSYGNGWHIAAVTLFSTVGLCIGRIGCLREHGIWWKWGMGKRCFGLLLLLMLRGGEEVWSNTAAIYGD